MTKPMPLKDGNTVVYTNQPGGHHPMLVTKDQGSDDIIHLLCKSCGVRFTHTRDILRKLPDKKEE